MRVLVTGGNGFVGRRLLHKLLGMPGVSAVAGLRNQRALELDLVCEQRVLGDLATASFSAAQFSGIDVLVHTAARVHVMQDVEVDSLLTYRQVNVAALRRLAEAAVQAGVKRFIFVSSIKVNGEETLPGRVFTAGDVPAPKDHYSISKYEAEQALREVCENSDMEWVVVRPPLVYGPGVKANFQRLMRTLRRGLPLPVGALRNRRSLVALDNLVDLLITCLTHPRAANQTFLVSDGNDLSVVELTEALAQLLGSRSWLIPIPAAFLRVALRMIGRADVAQRLCGDLRVDIEKTCSVLDWYPPVAANDGLALTVAHYLECRP